MFDGRQWSEVGELSGYQASDDMAGIASKITSEATPINNEADALGKGQVTASDAGQDFTDKGTAYLNALQNNLIASVKAFSTATTTLGQLLSQTYGAYSATEGSTASQLTRSGN